MAVYEREVEWIEGGHKWVVRDARWAERKLAAALNFNFAEILVPRKGVRVPIEPLQVTDLYGIFESGKRSCVTSCVTGGDG